MDSQYWDWRTQGRCSTLTVEEYDKLFFPDQGRSINKAKEICKDCSVIANCLQFALDNAIEGIWAGTSYADRCRMQKARYLMGSHFTPKKKKIVARSQIVFS